MESQLPENESKLFVAVGTRVIAAPAADGQIETGTIKAEPAECGPVILRIKTDPGDTEVEVKSDPVTEDTPGVDGQSEQLVGCTDQAVAVDTKPNPSDFDAVVSISEGSEGNVRKVVYTFPGFRAVVSKPSKLSQTLWPPDQPAELTEGATAASQTPSSAAVIKEDISGLAIQFLAQRAAQHVFLTEPLPPKSKSYTVDVQGGPSESSAASKKRPRLTLSVDEEQTPSHSGSQIKQRRYTIPGGRTCVCEICNAVLSAPASLKTHMLIHSGDKPYACVMCDATFRHQSTLKRHMCIHTGEKKFTCDVCQSPFARKTELTQHQRSHSTARPFICKICGSSYKHPKDLSQHLRAHVRNMPFKESGSLKEQTDSHENSSLNCDICREKCDSIAALTQHMIKKHVPNVSGNSSSESQTDEDFANMCSICGIKMPNATLLTMHIQDSHLSENLKVIAQTAQDSESSEHSCKTCGSQFTTASALVQHIKQKHWFSAGESQAEQASEDSQICSCNICGMEYPRLKSLAQHMKKSHGINLLPCSKCGTSFVQMQDWLEHLKVCF